jgi:biopolymer transport protein ExbD
VIVDRQNSLFINGMPSSVAELKDSVGAYLGNKPRGQRQVLLKVDREVPARIFTQVMLELGEVSADIFRILEPPPAPMNR